MMGTGRGGVRPGSGRPPGVSDKPIRTLKKATQAALALLAEVVTDKAGHLNVRVQAAGLILAHGAGAKTDATPNPATALPDPHGAEA